MAKFPTPDGSVNTDKVLSKSSSGSSSKFKVYLPQFEDTIIEYLI